MLNTERLTNAVDESSNPLAGVVTALKAEPHTAQASAGLTLDQARQLFVAAHEDLSDAELNEAVNFWNSPIGKKERELTTRATNKFRDGERDSASLRTVDAAHVSLARELVEMANIAEILGGFRGPFRMTPADVESYLIAEYAASITTAELESLLAFYRSATGQKVIAASKASAARLGKQVNL